MVISVSKGIAAAMASALLVLSLGPAPALASTLSAGDAAKPSAIQTQATAKKKTVYVVSKITISQSNSSFKNIVSFSHNKNGLVSRFSATNGELPQTYAYDGNGNLKTVNHVLKPGKKTWAFKDAKYKGGAISRAKCELFAQDYSYYDMTFKSKAGRVTSYVTKQYLKQGSKYVHACDARGTISYNKAGLVSKHRFKTVAQPNGPKAWGYSYDKKRNIKKISYIVGGRTTRSNTIKNTYNKRGLLAKQVVNIPTGLGSTQSTTYAYTYKAVKVSAAMAKKAAAQRWSIQNADQNFVLGGFSHGLELGMGDGGAWGTGMGAVCFFPAG